MAVLMVALGIFGVGCDSQEATRAPEEDPEPTEVPEMVTLTGDLQDVHDPAIIQAHGQYYLYSTGGGIQWRRSSETTQWTYQGDVLGEVPAWAEPITEGDLWAPDVAYFNEQYHLYYSASTFGSGRSAIGVATTPTLSPDRANYEWTDHGKVIESYESDSYNAIDPALFVDDQDRVWMAFGSWNETGIRMRRLDPETGMPSDTDSTLYQLANRPNAAENAIEAPYLIHRDGYYYLFVSFGHCCQGVDSDYNVRVGRSESITGPYVDRDGTPMTEGGGTLVIESTPNWKGTGHNSVLQEDGETYLVYHAYSVSEDGTPHLRISPIEWENGWPVVPMTQ
ncbi:arabinan endo-1,5-alpha-L-arabinosidase [Longimonas halophila]|nr:arabinan endo-1,5-alpha-L-arabinosidase [Longimonas halophila]